MLNFKLFVLSLLSCNLIIFKTSAIHNQPADNHDTHIEQCNHKHELTDSEVSYGQKAEHNEAKVA